VIYRLVLAAHSLNRWLVFGLLLVATVRGVRGWLARRDWTAADERTGRALTAVVDLQLLLGLVLYVVLSPLPRIGWADMAATLDNRVLQFWTLEHAPTMVVAVVIVHIGRVRSRRADAPARRHRPAALSAGLATALVLAAIPWPFLEYGRPLLPRL